MDRFFIEKDANLYSFIDNKDDIKHISKVLRLKTGQNIEIVDKTKAEYKAEIISIEKDKIEFKIIEKVQINRELSIDINLYQGIPKGQKLDTIVQKSTELGVRNITLVKFKRCVAEIKEEKEDKKLQRLNRVAYEASKQSKRVEIPSVRETCSFKNLKNELEKNDLNIVFYEDERVSTLKDFFKTEDLSLIKSIGIIIGPEGGITEEEIEEMKGWGVKILSLGNRILRTETAAIVSIAIVGNEFN